MKKTIHLMFLLIVSSISYAQTTNIPDTIFEHYLETHSKIDGSVVAVGDANSMGNGTDGDHLVTTANISNITFLDVSDLGISDMTGIEDFTSLTDFYCARNNITSITLPNVTTLNAFVVEDNQLTTINFPNSITNLGEFGCQNNNITSIDFNNITYINFFVGDNNQFTVLDFSTTDVEGINCSNNPNLESIDFRNGADYAEVYAFNATNNPNLTCIFVDDVTYANANWTNIDATSNFVDTQVACDAVSVTTTYVPDDNFEQALIDLGYDDTLDDYVVTANINSISFLNLDNKNISDLTGIEDFTGVETFICSNNSLTTLDASNNHFLEFACDNNQLTSIILNADARVVDCSNNQLTSINTPASLANLNCSNNQFTVLDLSGVNQELSVLNCSNNQLTSLDLRNGINTQIVDHYDFDARNNPNLTCIFVDDSTYSTNTWTNIDATSHFVTTQAACDAVSVITTYVPDDNFEQALIDLGYDDTLDDYVVTDNINTIQVLDVSNKNIADLTGIEDFSALLNLNCNQNQLTAIDISNNTNLQILECSFNQLPSINVSNSINLQELTLIENPISALDVTHNSNLIALYFGNNNVPNASISTIDISNNLLLHEIGFTFTNISAIDVSNQPDLTTLFVRNNILENLDVSQNPNLTDLVCNDNQLHTLNVKNGNNTNFTRFNAINNSFLSCIQVDDSVWSTTNWTNINGAETFSNECHYFQTYVPDDNFEQALIDLGYDTGALDDYVPTDAIKVVTSLNVSDKNIADLTGIEDFEALVNLNCNNNTLTNLSTDGNMNLETLSCEYNQLTSLAFFNNINLIKVYCNNNQLTQLNYLYYSQNLKELDCSYNALNDIEIYSNTQLEKLYIIANQFTSFNLSNNTSLIEFECNDNQLTSLDVRNGNNTNITVFRTHNNPNLTCIFVDDVTYSTNNWADSTWFHVDATSTFIADEAACTALATEEFALNEFKILSNPVFDTIKISIQEVAEYRLINMNGKILQKGRLTIGYNTINATKLAKGIYFLNISSLNKNITKKIIK